ncbi:MAG: ABC transporter permease [Bacteroidota bacterium]
MPQPPKYTLRFLRWFCREDHLEEIEGDLMELFEQRYPQEPAKAKRKFFWGVLTHFRPDYIKSFQPSIQIIHPAMIRHNLLISYRSFLRNRRTFFINLVSLSTSLACTLLIYLWVNNEMSVDKFHERDEQIFQVLHNIPSANDVITTEHTPGLLARTLESEVPEVSHATSVVPATWFDGRKGIISFEEIHIRVAPQYVEDNFADIFSIKFTQGGLFPSESDDQGVAISTEVAEKLFGKSENALGKVINWNLGNLGGLFKVVGVFLAPPKSATDQYDVLFPYNQFLNSRPFLSDWSNSDPSTYILVNESINLEQINQKLTAILQAKVPDTKHSLFVRKYSDQYLFNQYKNGVQAGGRIEYVWLFSLIALFLLLMGCINFMNLATAKATIKAKEIGIKKTMGVQRKQLIIQYLSESILMALIALALAICMVLGVLPQFNAILGTDLEWVLNRELILGGLGITLLSGILAGTYPALYLSGFNPAAILKGKTPFLGKTNRSSEAFIRKGLIVFQVVISIILIASVLVINQQIAFIKAKDLGYDQGQLLHFEVEDTYSQPDGEFDEQIWENEMISYLTQIRQIPGIQSVGTFSHDLIGDHGGLSGLDWEPGDEDRSIRFRNLEVGHNFIETMGIKLLEGRPFSLEYGDESSKLILNEAAVKVMGLSQPVGKTVHMWGQDREIIGVVDNFHFESLHETIHPCLMQFYSGSSQIMVKITEGREEETLKRLHTFFASNFPSLPFEYEFFDSDLQGLYRSEHRMAGLSTYFAGIAILISCLGLLGLAAFSAERRTKEIGIRKILGSSIWNIITLLSAEFTKIIGVAVLIALPISFVVTKKWLEGFAFKVEPAVGVFLLSALLSIIIAWLTVGFQAFRAASIDPVTCLKDE